MSCWDCGVGMAALCTLQSPSQDRSHYRHPPCGFTSAFYASMKREAGGFQIIANCRITMASKLIFNSTAFHWTQNFYQSHLIEASTHTREQTWVNVFFVCLFVLLTGRGKHSPCVAGAFFHASAWCPRGASTS